MNILYIQRKDTPGGAQQALKRVLNSRYLSAHRIVLVTEGKNSFFPEKENITVLRVNFPSSRSLLARVYKNRAWARKVAQIIRNLEFTPDIVHANEYIESLLSLELSRLLKATNVISLRSALMTKNDFFKYRCHLGDTLITVSQQMKNDIGNYYGGKLEIVEEFLYESEFFPDKEDLKSFPSKILVIGNPSFNKGWDIAMEAIEKLNTKFPNAVKELGFTGKIKNKRALRGIKIVHEEKFANLAKGVREYDMVISPSRSESFGLANLETIAAGVPLLASKKGVVAEFMPKEWLFEPNSEELYNRLVFMYENRKKLKFPHEKLKEVIRTRFSEKRSMEKLLDIYRRSVIEKKSGLSDRQ